MLGSDTDKGGTTEKWIMNRVGIEERRVANQVETHEFMGTAAGRMALQRARHYLNQQGVDRSEISVIVTTSTGHPNQVPPQAAILQNEFKLNKAHGHAQDVPAFDLFTDKVPALQYAMAGCEEHFGTANFLVGGKRTYLTGGDDDSFIFTPETAKAVIKYHNRPSIAQRIAKNLGLNEQYNFDLSNGCSSFVYGLALANGLNQRKPGYTLVVSVDRMLDITDENDRGTVVLFGDAASAVLLEPSELPGFVYFNLETDGSQQNLIHLDSRGCVHQDGPTVYDWVLDIYPRLIEEGLEHCEGQGTVYICGHQPNMRAVKFAERRLPQVEFVRTAHKTGNCSGTTSAFALDAIASKLREGDYVIGPVFGTGLSKGVYVHRT